VSSAHGWHEGRSNTTSSWKYPVLHTHLVPPSVGSDCEFCRHLTHATSPRTPEYSPLAHGVHGSLLTVALYLPIAHCVHAPMCW
jgi:hypothetical protein